MRLSDWSSDLCSSDLGFSWEMRLLDAIELGLGFGGGGETHFGVVGIMTGAATIFFAYLGFDAVSTAAEETRNPQRDLPIGILGSLAICTVLYIVVSDRTSTRLNSSH